MQQSEISFDFIMTQVGNESIGKGPDTQQDGGPLSVLPHLNVAICSSLATPVSSRALAGVGGGHA